MVKEYHDTKRLTHMWLLSIHHEILERLEIKTLTEIFVRHTPDFNATFSTFKTTVIHNCGTFVIVVGGIELLQTFTIHK